MKESGKRFQGYPYFGPGPWTTFVDRVHGPPVMDRVHGHFFLNNEK